MSKKITCPECNGKSGHTSSGDGWEEWDECPCCNPDGENDTGMVTIARLSKYLDDTRAEAARIDAMIERERRDHPERFT